MDESFQLMEAQSTMETNDLLDDQVSSTSSAVSDESSSQSTDADNDSIDESMAAATDELFRTVDSWSNDRKAYLNLSLSPKGRKFYKSRADLRKSYCANTGLGLHYSPSK